MLPSLAEWISALEADVGKIGDGEDVHHAPGLIGGIALQRAPDRLAHGAARAVAADDVARLHGFDLAPHARHRPFQRGGHRIVGVAVAGRIVQIDQPPRE